MVLLQRLSCVWQAVSENNVFMCGGVMDKNLGLIVLVECFDKAGKSLWLFIGSVTLECLAALMMVLLNFLFPSSNRWRLSL